MSVSSRFLRITGGPPRRGLPRCVPLVCILLLIGGPGLPIAQAQLVDASAAETVANNWIGLVIANRGSWGGEPTARVAETEEFRRGDRMLGYHCRIVPRGYVIVSPLMQMAPVHDFGYEGDLDVERVDGLADFLRERLERRLDLIEERLGPVAKIPAAMLEAALGSQHREMWEILDRDPARFRADLARGELRIDYQQGEELITSRWHQYPPYNEQCPEVPPGNPCTYDHCLVGCTALAAAEIFHHWCWPPYGVTPYDDRYDWWNMPRRITVSSPGYQIDAVAELCAELGDGMSMYYCITEDGCGSYASFRAAKYAFDTYFYYSPQSDSLMRNDYPDDAVWFNFIKEQHNLNRPIEYGIEGHAIVVDGWLEVEPGPDRYVHACAGFTDTTQTTWYELDEILWSHGTNEMMVRNIFPDCVVDNPLSGAYLASQQPHSHWYIDRDNCSEGALFGDATQVQFLPRVVVGCTSPGGDAIRFYGGSPYHTRLFSRGDPTKGVRLDGGGALALYGGGHIVMR